MKSLSSLWLYSNDISDLTPLAGLSSLKKLNIFGNPITDLSPLADLTVLDWLDITGLDIGGDISPLAGLHELELLQALDAGIRDLSPLSALTKLSFLHLEGNLICDLTPLLDNPELGEGVEIYLNGNPLSEEAISTQIPALRERGVWVGFSR